MANPWFRLWTDMVNDPKWRTIARVSGEEVSRVLSVYLHMLTCASNASERGRTEGWSDEDVATALDLNTAQVASIREAMQGRVLDGDYLRGWEKRQPLREDGAAQRAKAYRERQKEAKETKQTQPNALERNGTLDKSREEEIKKTPKSKAEPATASRLPADWMPDSDMVEFCKAERPDLMPEAVGHRFRDYWIAQPGVKGRKADWLATWRNWVRNERPGMQARASPGPPAKFDPTAHVNRNKTARPNDERTITVDEHGKPV